jgi:hypothetical protein
LFFGVLTGVSVIGLLALYQGQYREITWKDFVTSYLSRGAVCSKFELYVVFEIM